MFIFEINAAGHLAPKLRMMAAFSSEAECNQLGEELAAKMSYKDEKLKSFSHCIPRDAFDVDGLQTDKFD